MRNKALLDDFRWGWLARRRPLQQWHRRWRWKFSFWRSVSGDCVEVVLKLYVDLSCYWKTVEADVMLMQEWKEKMGRKASLLIDSLVYTPWIIDNILTVLCLGYSNFPIRLPQRSAMISASFKRSSFTFNEWQCQIMSSFPPTTGEIPHIVIFLAFTAIWQWFKILTDIAKVLTGKPATWTRKPVADHLLIRFVNSIKYRKLINAIIKVLEWKINSKYRRGIFEIQLYLDFGWGKRTLVGTAGMDCSRCRFIW